ncbi:unnamed protein product [Blepharisma stoltei]|uniref:Purple acid phosphatase n=1 Tax=Blepharisma stoltei TaxID=1481888 RepID=A0AAU9JSF9_9CILI|nr:unnamed protein product [Blepharisma stoltei]
MSGVKSILLMIFCYVEVNGGYLYPEQIHISWTENSNEMRATWVTYLESQPIAAYSSISLKGSSQDWTFVVGETKPFLESNTGDSIKLHYFGIIGIVPVIIYFFLWFHYNLALLFWSFIFSAIYTHLIPTENKIAEEFIYIFNEGLYGIDFYGILNIVIDATLSGELNFGFGERYQYVHTAVFYDLSPDTWYEYKVGNLGFWSKKYVFYGRTPDSENNFEDVNDPYTMIIFGDLGTGPIAQPTKKLLEKEALEGNSLGIFHLGDIAYNLDKKNGKIGDEYLNMIEPIAASLPYMTVPGNHEKFYNYTQYKSRFYMPVNNKNQGTGYFYSLNLGPIHFIFHNTNLYFDESTKIEAEIQLKWLINDLNKANRNRKKRPWIIVMSHHPLYCSQNWFEEGSQEDCGSEPAVLKPILEDLFYSNSVDLLLQAHVHNYERAAAIYKNKTIPSELDNHHWHINPKAPIYIVSGNAGNHYGRNDPKSATPQPWSRFLSDDYGFGRLKAINNTHLYWEQVSALTNKEIDYAWIVKKHPRYDPSLLEF